MVGDQTLFAGLFLGGLNVLQQIGWEGAEADRAGIFKYGSDE